MSNMPYPPKYIYFSEVDNGDFVVYSPEYCTLQTFGDSVKLNSLQHVEVVSAFKAYERECMEEEATFKAYEQQCMEEEANISNSGGSKSTMATISLPLAKPDEGVVTIDLTESVDSTITVNTGKSMGSSATIDLTESAISTITLNTGKRMGSSVTIDLTESTISTIIVNTGKRMASPSTSNHPRAAHVKRRKKKFICAVCGKVFSRKDSLNRHFDTVEHSD